MRGQSCSRDGRVRSRTNWFGCCSRTWRIRRFRYYWSLCPAAVNVAFRAKDEIAGLTVETDHPAEGTSSRAYAACRDAARPIRLDPAVAGIEAEVESTPVDQRQGLGREWGSDGASKLLGISAANDGKAIPTAHNRAPKMGIRRFIVMS